MTVTLTSADLARLEAAFATLVAPLEHEATEGWMAQSVSHVLPLIGADQALWLITDPPPGTGCMGGDGATLKQAAADYGAYYGQFDTGTMQTRRDLGLEVYHRDDLYSPPALRRTELYNDWCVPHRLMDIIGIGFDPIPGAVPSVLHFYHDRDHSPDDDEATGAFGARGLTLLRLLCPAFKAGVRVHLALRAHRERLGAALDALPHAIAVYDGRGRCVHENRSLGRMLDPALSGAPTTALLRRAISALVRRGLSEPVADWSLRTAAGAFRLTLARLNPGTPERLYLVLVESCRSAVAGSAASIRRRWRLTAREAEVALLLSHGASNATVARELGIRASTARRHTEAVLRKLAVPNRAAVASTLYEMP